MVGESDDPAVTPVPARLTDVTLRDGLQNERQIVPTSSKAALALQIAACGFDEIELTSFVSPRWVPQLGDAAELVALLAQDSRFPRSQLCSALVPNERGMESLLRANDDAGGDAPMIGKVSVFTAATETFSQKNTNASIDETITRFEPVIASAKKAGLATRGYVSCITRCPFEGDVQPDAVVRVARSLLGLGIDELDLGDTIGAATPESLRPVLAAVLGLVPNRGERAGAVTLHLHDTQGAAAACAQLAASLGVQSFDASVSGLGGCPYASTPQTRAPGNIDTRVLLRALTRTDLVHRLDTEALRGAERLARELIPDHPA